MFKNISLNFIFIYLMTIVFPMHSMRQISGDVFVQACKNGNFPVVKRYLQNGGDINYIHDGGNGYEAAAFGGQLEILKYLVEQKCNHSLLERYKPFRVAVQFGQVDIVRWYVNEKKFDVNQSDCFNVTALHVASGEKSSLSVLRFLLDVSNVAINQLNGCGTRPVHYAIVNGNLEGLKLLSEKGADFQVKDFGITLLHFAIRFAKSNQLEIVRFLVDEKKMNIEEPVLDVIGHRPLHAAVLWGTIELAKFLKLRGADIRATTNCNENAFVFACRDGKISFAEMLLPHVDVNGYFGICRNRTVLCEAVQSGNLKMVKFLLDNGADHALKGFFDETNTLLTAEDIAQHCGKHEIANYLEQVRLAKSMAQELLDELDEGNEESMKKENRPQAINNSKKKKKKKLSGIAVPAKIQRDIPEVTDAPIINAKQVLHAIDMNSASIGSKIVDFRSNRSGFKQTFISVYEDKTGLYMRDPQNKDVLIPFSQPIDNVGSSLAKNFLIKAAYSPHVQSKENISNDHHHNFTRKLDTEYGHFARTIVIDFRNNPQQKAYWEGQLGTKEVEAFWFELHCSIPGAIHMRKYQQRPTGNFKYVVLAKGLGEDDERVIVHRQFEFN